MINCKHTHKSKKMIAGVLMSIMIFNFSGVASTAFDQELMDSKVIQEQNIEEKKIDNEDIKFPEKEKSPFSTNNGDVSFALQYENAMQQITMGFNTNRSMVGSSTDCLSLFSKTYGDIDKANFQKFELPEGWNSQNMINDMSVSIIGAYESGLNSPEVKNLMSKINVGGTMAQISSGKNAMLSNNGPLSFSSLNGQIDSASLKSGAYGTLWSDPQINRARKSHDVGTMKNPKYTRTADNPYSIRNKLRRKLKTALK